MLHHIHCDDGLAVMHSLPTGSLDAVITDPPYGTTALSWDKAIDYRAFWEAADHAVKETGVVVVFCQQPMMTDLVNSNRKNFRYEIIWHKTAPVGFLDAKKRPLRAHENIAVFCRRWRGAKNALLSTYNPQFWFSTPYQKGEGKGTRCSHYGEVRTVARGSEDGRRYPLDVLTFANRVGAKSPHPTAKPVELMKWLISTYTNPGDHIGDPYMGAGASGVAATELGRGYVGAEIDPTHFATAQERIEAAFTREPAATGEGD